VRLRLAVLYTITSIAAGALSVYASVIGEESLGEGFSAYLIAFNDQYLVGYLLFNPLRVAQYVMDAYSSFNIWTDSGGLDVARLLRLPQLLLIVALAPAISSLITRFSYWLTTPARPLVICIVAYLLAWLMNPTINARYVMLITPVVVLFGLYARRNLGRAFS